MHRRQHLATTLKNKLISCVACEVENPKIVDIGGLRRTICQHCGHSHRIDLEPFDYSSFAMGGTGVTSERLEDQSRFILQHSRESTCALEVGCAAGDLALQLRGRKTFKIYDGVEISPAREKAAKTLDHVFAKPLGELFDTGEIKEASYDIVLSSHCLEHIEDPVALLRLMRRAMKPKGLLFLETPNRSGHTHLPFDDNRSHIHFFCAASLARMLARCGFEMMAFESGARLDARYSDCLRVMAQLRGTCAMPDTSLLTGVADEITGFGKLVVWGAGRMADEILAHYLDPSRISFFVDKDARKHGTTRLGAPVYSPEVLENGSDWCILINSLEMESSIRKEIFLRFETKVKRIIPLGELFDGIGAGS